MDDIDPEFEESPWPKVTKFLLVSSYSLLTLGIAANIFVFITVVRVMKILNKNLPDKHMLVYTLALSLVDSLVLLNLPFIICDLIYERWIFGEFMCKIHYVGDNLNKTMSTMVLTTVSFDRYLTVCRPFSSIHWKSIKSTVVILLSCLSCTLCLLSPLLFGTGLIAVDVIDDQVVTKCSYVESNYNVEHYFFYVVFAAGYCIPLTLMIFFHGSILFRVCKNGERLKQDAAFRRRRHSTIRHVTKRMLTITVFYFVCWTPYWFSNLFIQISYKSPVSTTFNNNDTGMQSIQQLQLENVTQADNTNYPNDRQSSPPQWVPVLCLIFYLLVYANSAINPFLYGVFNLELRRQCSRANEKKIRTHADGIPLKRSTNRTTAVVESSFQNRQTVLLMNNREYRGSSSKDRSGKFKYQVRNKLPSIIESTVMLDYDNDDNFAE